MSLTAVSAAKAGVPINPSDGNKASRQLVHSGPRKHAESLPAACRVAVALTAVKGKRAASDCLPRHKTKAAPSAAAHLMFSNQRMRRHDPYGVSFSAFPGAVLRILARVCPLVASMTVTASPVLS